MINRLLASGLLAGFAAGLFAALLHFAFLQDVILLGEQYETGARVHSFGGGENAAPVAQDHGTDGHTHGDDVGEGDASPLSRNTLTVLFTALIYAGYGLVLVTGFAVAEHFGRKVDARDGILWGIAGFAALQLAPAMGLAPELPGSVAADLTERQIWWLFAVLATGTGLAVLAFGRGIVPALIAIGLLAAPHLVGAPHPDGFFGVAPPEVSAEFSARVLGVGLAAWSALGWLAGRLWTRSPN